MRLISNAAVGRIVDAMAATLAQIMQLARIRLASTATLRFFFTAYLGRHTLT